MGEENGLNQINSIKLLSPYDQKKKFIEISESILKILKNLNIQEGLILT